MSASRQGGPEQGASEKVDVATAAIMVREAAALLEKHGGLWAQPLHDIARDLEARIAQESRS